MDKIEKKRQKDILRAWGISTFSSSKIRTLKSRREAAREYREAMLSSFDALEYLSRLQDKWEWSRSEKRRWWMNFISSPAFRQDEIDKAQRLLKVE